MKQAKTSKTIKKAPKPSPTPKMTAMERKYQAEDDVRTLVRAEEIKRDAARMREAKKIAKQKASEAAKVAGL